MLAGEQQADGQRQREESEGGARAGQACQGNANHTGAMLRPEGQCPGDGLMLNRAALLVEMGADKQGRDERQQERAERGRAQAAPPTPSEHQTGKSRQRERQADLTDQVGAARQGRSGDKPPGRQPLAALRALIADEGPERQRQEGHIGAEAV